MDKQFSKSVAMSGWGYRIGDMPDNPLADRKPLPFKEVVNKLLAYKPNKERKLLKNKENQKKSSKHV